MTPRRLLGILVLNFVVAGVGLQYLSVYLYRRQLIPTSCDGTVIHPLHDMISRIQDTDSWDAMLQALNARSSPNGIYQQVFFDQKVKFQYSLPSLIPLQLLRAVGVSDYGIIDALKWLSIVAFLAQIPCVFLILSRAFKQPQPLALRLSLALVMVISFYPLARAYQLGQIQIFLDLLFSVAFLNWIQQREGTSGFLVGVSALVKPQFGLFLLWGAVRKNWKFVISVALPLAIGALLGLAFYGLKNNLQYLDVIRYMSRHGEAYFPNQSVNGLLNRLLQNGSNLMWDRHGFAPFLPVVYYLTLLTSVIIVGLALFNRRPRTDTARISEFGMVAIAAVAASPIAWEHHYGVLLPLFAWVLPQATELPKRSGSVIVLLIAFVLCSDDWRMTNLLAGLSPLNVVQSTVLCGAMILFFHMRRRVRLEESA